MSSNKKLFPDDLFFSGNDIQASVTTFSNDLNVLSNFIFQWKVVFNVDLTKQARQVIFSRKTKKLLMPTLSFNSIPSKNSMFQKRLTLTLDIKLNF